MRNNRCCFFCRPSIFFSSFSTSFRDNENHWPQLIHVSGVECQIDRLACFAAYFSSFPKENAFQNLEEDLWTINRKTEFSDFSLTLTVSIIFPDFLKNSLTFPLTDSNPVIKKIPQKLNTDSVSFKTVKTVVYSSRSHVLFLGFTYVRGYLITQPGGYSGFRTEWQRTFKTPPQSWTE